MVLVLTLLSNGMDLNETECRRISFGMGQVHSQCKVMYFTMYLLCLSTKLTLSVMVHNRWI